MTKCHLGHGLTEDFLYKGVAFQEEVTHTIYICIPGQGLLKLSASQKRNESWTFFSTILRTNYFTEGGEGLCMTRNKGKNLSDRWKKELKDIRDSWIFEKVRLKAAKRVSGKRIVLKFVRETRTKSPYLPSKVTLAQLFTSFCAVTKRRNDLRPPTTMNNHP